MKKFLIIITLIIIFLLILGGTAYLIKNNDNHLINLNDELIESGEINKGTNVSIELTKKVTYDYEGVKFSLLIPEDWEYEQKTNESGDLETGINIYPKDSKDTFVDISYYENKFGVCGTGLETTTIKLDNGEDAKVGYYDGNSNWNFIFLQNDIAAINNGLKDENATVALEIVKKINIEN